MSLKGVAKETLKIIEDGGFTNEAGTWIDFSIEQNNSETNTRLYTPEELTLLLESPQQSELSTLKIEVTNEKTQEAVYRLVVHENETNVIVLNFASARNPGGGFLNGAKAQEEDLARCSGLYRCQLTQPKYYEANRVHKSLLYTDHVIYSPKVPWFRTHHRQLLNNFFMASVITAPAPNAGQVLRRDGSAWPKIEDVLRQRAGYVLSIAEQQGYRTLLLGAWGCGVFRNQPSMVADAFGQWLESDRFSKSFERIVFAIYDPSKKKETFAAFRNRFE